MSLAELLQQREDAKKFWKLAYYRPYGHPDTLCPNGELWRQKAATKEWEEWSNKPWQLDFHNAKGLNTSIPASQKALICGNREGKSHSSAHEVAIQATGHYPDWWDSTVFREPPIIVVAGITNDTTRNIIQAELLGDPEVPSALGTGAIPKHLILDTTRKPGVPNAFQSVTIQHTHGIAKIMFMAYEQDWKKFMAIKAHVVWGDEEPPHPVWAQFLRMTTDIPNAYIMLSFTPEEGVTQVVDGFLNNLKEGQAVINATWDDVPHLTEAKKRQILDALPPYQRDMRSKGIPLMGSGLVFPISEEDIKYAPKEVEIPRYWPRGCAMDLGKSDHPTAAVWIAWDRDLDILYVYDCWKGTGTISENATEIRRKTKDYIPVFWPHDATQKDPRSAKTYSDLYKDEGLNMWWESFTNPPRPGEKRGDLGVEAGIDAIWERMKSGRFKVSKHLHEWWEEFRMYHRKDGKIVDLKDDIMSATRYCAQSHRNFRVESQAFNRKTHQYSTKGIV